ncbi:aromatic-ring hydroxylase C-terminal domain-containing protein [Streptomyces malaysiensis]|uniref:aromatic-ring hydroxylase C-terminal domain-containing protein n=1 Tax=Streptomyces malaysiensis TaxID=92644 RepID=UPI003220070C
MPSIRDSPPRCPPLPPTTATCVSATSRRSNTYRSLIARPPGQPCSAAPRAGPTAGPTSSRPPYVDNNTRTSCPHFRRLWHRPTIVRHAPGLAASPPARYMLKVARRECFSLPLPLPSMGTDQLLREAATHRVDGRRSSDRSAPSVPRHGVPTDTSTMAAEHSRGHGEAMVLHGSDELAVHGTAKRRSSSSHTRSAVKRSAPRPPTTTTSSPSSRSRTERSRTGATAATRSPCSTPSAGRLPASERRRVRRARPRSRRRTAVRPSPARRHERPAGCPCAVLNRCLHGSAMGWESRVRYAAGQARNDLGSGAVLVRPDGVVAWAGERHPDREAFERAAVQWYGSPGA